MLHIDRCATRIAALGNQWGPAVGAFAQPMS